VRYRERDEVQRWLFRRGIGRLAGHPVFFLDESGVNRRLYGTHARAPRGEAVHEDTPGLNLIEYIWATLRESGAARFTKGEGQASFYL
jgi:hypothetical protein